MSRSLNDLAPIVSIMAQSFIQECAKQHIDILITATYRSIEDQNKLYAQGRTEPGPIVTKAKGGNSFHNYKVAFDFVPLVNGKARYDDIRLFEKCGQIAESVGLEWAGRWKNFCEMAHCQYTGGLTLADFKSGKRLPQ